MDSTPFDILARLLTHSFPRRGALSRALIGTLGLLGCVGTRDAAAKNCKKIDKKKRKKCLAKAKAGDGTPTGCATGTRDCNGTCIAVDACWQLMPAAGMRSASRSGPSAPRGSATPAGRVWRCRPTMGARASKTTPPAVAWLPSPAGVPQASASRKRGSQGVEHTPGEALVPSYPVVLAISSLIPLSLLINRSGGT
jgi:hypothetical protein